MRSLETARMQDLPMPASAQEVGRPAPFPSSTFRQQSRSSATSCSRPTKGVTPRDREASKRLTFWTSRKTVQAGVGVSKPLRVKTPSDFRSNISPKKPSRKLRNHHAARLSQCLQACRQIGGLAHRRPVPEPTLVRSIRRQRRCRSRYRCGPWNSPSPVCEGRDHSGHIQTGSNRRLQHASSWARGKPK